MARKIRPLAKSKRRALLLKVAAHIEKHPELYNFYSHGQGLTAHDAMCPLQRAAKFLRVKAGGSASVLDKAAQALGFDTDVGFYRAADRILADMQGLSRVDHARPWLLRTRETVVTGRVVGSTIPQIVMALRYMAWSL